MTGDVLVGGAIALVEPAVNTVAYHFHEKVWVRIRKAKAKAQAKAARVDSALAARKTA